MTSAPRRSTVELRLDPRQHEHRVPGHARPRRQSESPPGSGRLFDLAQPPPCRRHRIGAGRSSATAEVPPGERWPDRRRHRPGAPPTSRPMRHVGPGENGRHRPTRWRNRSFMASPEAGSGCVRPRAGTRATRGLAGHRSDPVPDGHSLRPGIPVSSSSMARA